MRSGEGIGRANAPSPYFGAAVIATGLLVLVVGVYFLNKSDEPLRLVVPTADGITPPTDSDGRTVEIPPSQPATAVIFGADGTVLRPDPVRARVLDTDRRVEILVTLPPNTVVDAVTGAIIPRPPGTSGPTTVTTGPTGSTGSSGPPPTTPTPTDPPTSPTTPTPTDPPTTSTTAPPDTTTTTPPETTTTTVDETTTTTGDTTPEQPPQ